MLHRYITNWTLLILIALPGIALISAVMPNNHPFEGHENTYWTVSMVESPELDQEDYQGYTLKVHDDGEMYINSSEYYSNGNWSWRNPYISFSFDSQDPLLNILSQSWTVRFSESEQLLLISKDRAHRLLIKKQASQNS